MDLNQHRFARILVPLDGAGLAEPALSVAHRIAQPGSQIILLQILPGMETSSHYSGAAYFSVHGGQRQHHMTAVHELNQLADESRVKVPSVRIQAIIANGSPAGAILDFATDPGVDLIVLGFSSSAGRRFPGLDRVLQRVARTSPVPVLIAKERVSNGREVGSSFDRIVVVASDRESVTVVFAFAEQLAESHRQAPVHFLTCRDAMWTESRSTGIWTDINPVELLLNTSCRLEQAGHFVTVGEIPCDSVADVSTALGPGDLVIVANSDSDHGLGDRVLQLTGDSAQSAVVMVPFSNALSRDRADRADLLAP